VLSVRRTDDLDAVRALDRATFPLDAPVDPQPHDVWWLASIDGDPAGFCGLRVYTNGFGYLCRAGVLPRFRGRGVQRRMIAVRTAEARRLGLRHLLTDTWLHNSASINSLVACGFRAFHPERPWAMRDSIYWRRDLGGGQ
jgi:GNAT superfamily N-acetyltransferase